MGFFKEYFCQQVPRSGKDIPPYYRRCLLYNEYILEVYFAVCFFLFPLINSSRWEWIPLLFMAFTGFSIRVVHSRGIRVSLMLYAVLCCGWVAWNVYYFGWNSGVQHFLTLMLVLAFFNVYDKPLYKFFWFVGTLGFRVFLFSHAQRNPAVYAMEIGASTVYQTVNTLAFFLMLAITCILFSTNIQEAERRLLLRNQELHREAGTDPLTGLPNRRAMLERIEQYCKVNRDSPFSVAIADLDFFKKVNDTYGHNCGDYTLVSLTNLIRQQAANRYSACRWGGEEFCFFLPDMNLDEAAVLMNDLCIEVEKMKLCYEGQKFSITVTIGVEEYDFVSPLEALMESADEKLYMGKNAGRNQVVK